MNKEGGGETEYGSLSVQQLWKRLDDFDEVTREEKLEIFAEIEKRNPEIIRQTFYGAGYDFFIVNNDSLKEGTRVTQLQESLEYSYGHAVFQAEEPAEQLRIGRDAVREGMESAKEALMSEYKIHLQPDRRHISEVMRRLLEMMKDENNADLRSVIGAFKIKARPDAGEKNVFPEVVVYTRAGTGTDASGKSEGRRNMERALAAVVEAMRGLEPFGQKDRAPRYNAKVNDLVYVAQSGGDLKNFLKRIGLLDEFFDSSSNYGFQRGEKAPTLPQESEGVPTPVSADEVGRLEKLLAKIIRSRAAGVHNPSLIEHAIREVEGCLLRRPPEDLLARLQQMRDELAKYDISGRSRSPGK